MYLLFVSSCVSKALFCELSSDGSLAADIRGGFLIGSRVFELDLLLPRGAPLRFGSGLRSFC